jgi:hypothetical protein
VPTLCKRTYVCVSSLGALPRQASNDPYIIIHTGLENELLTLAKRMSVTSREDLHAGRSYDYGV